MYTAGPTHSATHQSSNPTIDLLPWQLTPTPAHKPLALVMNYCACERSCLGGARVRSTMDLQ